MGQSSSATNGGGARGSRAAPLPAKPLNGYFSSIPTTVFEVMSQMAAQHGSVNLGQGFPDDEGPHSMKTQAAAAILEHHNQYPPLLGMPELRQGVAEHSKRCQGIPCNWKNEVLITLGATEGIAACMLGLLNAGDEVVAFDPMYDSYAGMAARAGGVVKPVPLTLPDLGLPPQEELESAFGPKTKLLFLNSPHNPTGKVFSLEELRRLAALCIKHDVIAVCDEVYEHLLLDSAKHCSLRSLPGMANRSIRLGSAGKTFSLTAWKIGWVTGPAALLAPVIKAHQFLAFTVPSNLQRAVAFGLKSERGFFERLRQQLSAKRDMLAGPLRELGFGVLQAETGHGAYFLVCDASKFMRPGETDVDFCARLTKEALVTLIPVSAFYVSPAPPRHLVRFAFCKEDAKLTTAIERLRGYLKPE